MSHSDHVTLTCEGTIKSEACVALAGAAVAHKALSIQCQVFVCHFDLLLTTAPPNMCVGEPPRPPLNTFPHINKPYRCRNAWGPALTQLLEFSLLIRRLFGTFRRHTPVPAQHILTHRPDINHQHICWSFGIHTHMGHKWETNNVTQMIKWWLKAHTDSYCSQSMVLLRWAGFERMETRRTLKME